MRVVYLELISKDDLEGSVNVIFKCINNNANK